MRRETVHVSHLWFFLIYFARYVQYDLADFHRDIFTATEDDSIKRCAIVAFRGSGKSTIISLSYILWAIMGKEQRKFVLLVARTQEQAKLMLRNIRTELERNLLLRFDLGPFQETEDEWRNSTLVLSNFNARITVISVDQSMRGMRHAEFRPDLIVCDDIEDDDSVKTRESRDNTYRWITRELIPAGDKHTRFFIVGNYLHQDAVTQRLREVYENDKHSQYIHVPLLDDDGNITWIGKYPDMEAIEEERIRVNDPVAWHQEFLLKIIATDDQVIHLDWIQYYERLPSDAEAEMICAGTGVDLAISQKSSADFTAMVSARMYKMRDTGKKKIYVLPHPINARLSHKKTLDTARDLAACIGSGHRFYVEDVGYQSSVIEHLKFGGLTAEGVPVHGQDKRSRLASVSHLVEDGTVVFPQYGVKHLIEQLVGFRVEKHDDLCDAFSTLMISLMKKMRRGGFAFYILGDDDD